jgi:hypothetical protein
MTRPGGSFAIIFLDQYLKKERVVMTVAQIAERESLYHRILTLPDADFGLVKEYIDDLEAHEPNEETITAILEGDELAKMYCSRFN